MTVRNIVEQSLRQLSNYLVKEECDRLGRADLVEFVELKLLNRETVKILKRRSQPNHEKDEKHEEIKKQINKLRIVKKVIRTGNFAMDLLTDELKVTPTPDIYFILTLPLRNRNWFCSPTTFRPNHFWFKSLR